MKRLANCEWEKVQHTHSLTLVQCVLLIVCGVFRSMKFDSYLSQSVENTYTVPLSTGISFRFFHFQHCKWFDLFPFDLFSGLQSAYAIFGARFLRYKWIFLASFTIASNAYASVCVCVCLWANSIHSVRIYFVLIFIIIVGFQFDGNISIEIP